MSGRTSISAMLPVWHGKRHEGHKNPAAGYFKRNNQIAKTAFWVVVISVVVLLAVQRFVLWRRRKSSIREAHILTEHNHNSDMRQRQSSSTVSQKTTSAVSIFRSIGYPRLRLVGRYSRHITFPSQGEAIFLALYWAMIMILLWTNVIFKSPSPALGIRWEVVGFRAAWVSTVQLPLLYCTGCRINPISIITNISHERMNWFHQWVARTMFMTLVVHWAFFYREWDIVHVVQEQIKNMPMIIWGFAAWAAMGVMVITSFAIFRAWCYELWIISHIIMAYAVLVLSYTHTHCTTYFVEASLGFIAFDVLGRLWLYARKNLHVLRRGAGWLPELGHYAELEILNHEYIQVSISNPGFDWSPGQHAYLYVPQVRALESHPFTISSVAATGSNSSSDSKIVIIIKAHAGFTGALYRSALGSEVTNVRALVQGPYGNPPPLDHYDTVVFVASGNRASFTVPLLQDLSSNPGRVTRISFHLVMSDEQMIYWYYPQLIQSIKSASEYDIKLEVVVHITKHVSHPQKTRLDDVEMWADDNYSIGGDSSEGSRSSTDTYAPVSTDKEDESSRLMTDSNAMTQAEREHNNSTPVPISADQPSTPFTADQEKQDEESTALLPNAASDSIETNTIRNPATQANEDTHFHPSLPKPLPEKLPSTIKLISGRPKAPSLILPSIQHTPARGQVMVVAATAPGLLTDITNFVARTSYKVGRGRMSTLDGGKLGEIELWSERNGD